MFSLEDFGFQFTLLISYHSLLSSTFLARQQARMTPTIWKTVTTARLLAMAGTLPEIRRSKQPVVIWVLGGSGQVRVALLQQEPGAPPVKSVKSSTPQHSRLVMIWFHRRVTLFSVPATEQPIIH